MSNNNGTISVQGRGSIHVIPDVTRLEVMVESVFIDYESAYKQARENAQWMGQILEYNHLNKKLAKTIHFDISDHLVDEYDENDHYVGKIKDGFDSRFIFYVFKAMYSKKVNIPFFNQTTGIQNLQVKEYLKNEMFYNRSWVGVSIQDGIEDCNRMITLLQERKQIIINDVVTGKVKVV